ncbi:hypothetical protein CC2G_004059 [Coprinopsis cinerea AmutBmut pab1-1]|nr:hypothetical protein CC2G_004059 [Coprinopsis cinerea AmutBmut pab1-1]
MFKLSTSFVLLTALAALAPVQGAPALAARQGSDVHRQNALDAQRLNAQYATIKATDSCRSGENACVDGGFAQCIAGKWVVQPCAGALRCYALPLVNAPGTSNTCDTQEGAELRFKNAGVQGGTRGNGSSSPPAPAEDDEDIPDCDDEDEEDLAERAFAEDETYRYFYRRQLPEEDEEPTLPISSVVPVSSLPVPSVSASASIEPSSAVPSITGTPSSSSSAAIVTPTVVIGDDGIVTVTLVSTVTETATDCGLATSSTPVPRTVVSAVASSSAVLSSSGIPTSRPTASSSSAPITLVAAPTPSSFTFELSPTA